LDTNTASAQWIVAPGARTSATGNSGTANLGGDFLPGNGDSGTNNGIFIYTLAFNIVGTGTVGSTITNAVSISLTISADDQYRVYVNPRATVPRFPAQQRQVRALRLEQHIVRDGLQNGTNGTPHFRKSPIPEVGTTYLTIVVENTNSVVGTSTNTARNPSGLRVYQVGSAAIVDGRPIPEVGAWLPVVRCTIGLYGLVAWRRRRSGAVVHFSAD